MMWEDGTKEERQRQRETEKERDRDRGREKTLKTEENEKRGRGEILVERPQTLVLLRKRLSRSQSVACAEVQAGAFKALAGLAPTKKPSQRLNSLVRVSSQVERDQKKTRACELVHHRRCSKWPPLSRTHAEHL